MNKKVSLFLALAGLMLGACSSSDDVNGGGAGTGESGTSYIAVNIKSVGSLGAATRADGDYTQGGGTYEDGTADEGGISKVRFFFFNNDGSAYILKGQQVNYKDLDASNNGEVNHIETIEGKTTAMLVIEGETKTAPAYMIAVVNPQTLTKLENKAYRESQLRDDFTDNKFVKITTDGSGKKYGDFVMSNSVYAENGARVCASSVSGHVAANSKSAKDNPVDIYVERVLAKVTTGINTENNKWKQTSDGKWETKVGEINFSTEGREEDKRDVYAVVEGWGLADENGKAELEKQIDVTSGNWTSAIIGIDPWTVPIYHRCFWSSSVQITPGTNPIQNYEYSAFNNQLGSTPLYTCPNTPSWDEFNTDKVNEHPYDNTLTKVLVAAKLVYYDDDNTSHPADICKYRGMQILGENSVLNLVASDHNEYWTVNPSNPSEHVLLAPSDLEYTTENYETTNNANNSVDKLQAYEVRPVLKPGVKVYKKKSDGSFDTDDSNDELNAELAKSPVQVRKGGMTYYYTPIRHLAKTKDKLGYYGVVRNHSYRITIEEIEGFGTPVYNPDAVIDPMIPKDTETYLAARVNVLSWRVVPSNVKLDGTK